MKIVVIAPHMDMVTAISAQLGFRFADWAKAQGHNVKLLYGIEATRLPLMLSLLDEPTFVYYSGHGTEDEWIGNEVIFGLVTQSNAKWLSNRISATMACLTAKILGPEVITRGGFAYVGAVEPLYAAFEEMGYNYLEDWLEYMLLLPKGIVEDKAVGEAVNDLKAKALEFSQFYENEKPSSVWDWYAFSALSNSKAYTVLGNPALRLSEALATIEAQPPKNILESLMGIITRYLS